MDIEKVLNDYAVKVKKVAQMPFSTDEEKKLRLAEIDELEAIEQEIIAAWNEMLTAMEQRLPAAEARIAELETLLDPWVVETEMGVEEELMGMVEENLQEGGRARGLQADVKKSCLTCKFYVDPTDIYYEKCYECRGSESGYKEWRPKEGEGC